MQFRMTRHEMALFSVLLISSIAATALVALRWWHAGTGAFAFLVWNLLLAWVPFGAAGVLHLLERDERLTRPRAAALLLVWLIFFPNAPYIVTDFLHLRSRPEAPQWFDIVVIMSFAWTGMMLGFASLYWVQDYLRRRVGNISSIAISLVVLAASGFGIYLGRFGRFNSWDLLTRPAAVLSEVADRLLNPLSHPRTLAVTLFYGSFLILAYLTLLVFLAASGQLTARAGERDSARRRKDGETTCPPPTTSSSTA